MEGWRHKINQKYPVEVLAVLVVVLGLTVSGLLRGSGLEVLAAVLPPIRLVGGDSVVVACDGNRLLLSRQNRRQVTATCTGTSRVTPTPAPSPTSVPGEPTPTPAPGVTPSPTPVGSGGIVSTEVTAESLGSCTAEVHDKYVLTGSDGKRYRTWHPRQDRETGCVFGHEHGDDPSRSNISGILPVLFSFYDQGVEAHEGFKVNVVNYGDRNNEGSTALNSTRVVAHQGTGGAKRFTTRLHSLEIAFLGGPNGRNSGQRFFTGGMADTGGVGSICEARVGKTVMQTDCNESSDYEIWEFKLNGMVVSWSVFDPITERRPADNVALTLPGNRGCTHEVYTGPFNGTVAGYNYRPAPVPGGNGILYLATYKGGNTSDPQSQFKITRSACDFYSQIGSKN